MMNRVLEAVIAALLLAAVGVAFTAVIYRYALGTALSWSFEGLHAAGDAAIAAIAARSTHRHP